MSGEESVDELIEFEKRLNSFEFKSNSLVYAKWNGTNAIKNVYNKEKRRKNKSKEDQILNRLDLWITVCRVKKEIHKSVTENGKYSTMPFSKIRRPFLRRTHSLEETVDINCTTKCSGMLYKHRNKMYDGLFKNKSSSSMSSGSRDRSISKEDIYGDVILSDNSENEESDYKFKSNRVTSRVKKTSRKNSTDSSKSEEQNYWTKSFTVRKGNDRRSDSLKNGESCHIRLLPSKCPVDGVLDPSDTMKSYKQTKVLVESSSNKFNPYPIFYSPENEMNGDKGYHNEKRSEYNRSYSDEPRRKFKSKSNENLTTYRSGIAKFEDECRNLYNTAPQDIRIHDTYNMNKINYYKNNPQHQTIRRSQDICTMQDYINSIKESRNSIKQCTQDIKNFLESPPNSNKNEDKEQTFTKDGDTPRNKKRGFMTSSSTPDISKLISKSDEKPKVSIFSKNDYSRSWSDMKSILHGEYLKEYLV